MSYGYAVEERILYRDPKPSDDPTYKEIGSVPHGARFPIRVIEFENPGHGETFARWVQQHPNAEILDIKFSAASDHDKASWRVQIVPMTFMLVVYREREDAQAGEEEGER